MKKSTLLFFLLGFVLCFNNASAQKIISKADFYLTDESGKKISATFSSLDDFNDSGIAIFSIGGKLQASPNDYESDYSRNSLVGAKYGLINNKGKVIVEASYDNITNFSYSNDTLFVVTLGEKKGLINYKGKLIIPINHKDVSYTYYNNSAVKITTTNEQYQLLSFDGKPLTAVYDYFDVKKNGTSFTSKGKYGWLDADFKVSIPAVYLKLDYLKSCNKFIAQDKSFKFYIINSKNEKMNGIKYDEIRAIYNSNNYDEIIGYKVKKKDKYGFMNADFKEIISPQFIDISEIQVKCNSLILTCEKRNREIYLYDENGMKIGKNKYSYVRNSDVYDKYLIVRPYSKADADKYYSSNTNYNLIDLQGNVVMKDKFSDYSIGYVYDGEPLMILKSKSGWSAYSKDLKAVISSSQVAPEKITYLDHLGDNYYSVQIGGDESGYGKPKGGVWGVFDNTGKQILPIEYEDITYKSTYNSDDNKFQFKKAGKYGVMKTDGSIIFQPEYSDISCSGDYCITKKFFEDGNTEKYGIISTEEKKEIIAPQYEYLERLYYGSDNNYIFRQNGKFGILSAKKGKVIIDAKFNFIKSAELYNNDYYLINSFGSVETSSNDWEWGGSSDKPKVKGGTWGVINIKGDTIVPIKYKKLTFIRDSFINAVDEEDKAYIINLKGFKKLTPDGANYLESASYSYYDPIYFLMGKNVQFDDYGYKKEGTYGICDSKGKTIIDFKYGEIEMNGNDFHCTNPEAKTFDLISKEGKVLITNANAISELNDSMYLVKKGDNEVFLYNSKSNSTDNLQNAVAYSASDYLWSSSIIGIKTKENKWGAINAQGEWLIQPTYCDFVGDNKSSCIAAVCEGNIMKYGVIDAEQNVLIPFIYESIESSWSNTYSCLKNNVIYKVNLSNEVLSTEKASDSKLRE
jgi:hypothetical protein